MKRGGDSLLHNPAAVPKKRKKRKEENALNISRVTEGLTDKEALKRDNRDEEEEEDEGDDGVVSVDLKTKSVQELLNCKDRSVDTISHHGGSHRSYMADKILKLHAMHTPSEKTGHVVSDDIFKGCYLFVNGDTQPSRYEIQRLVMMHGGNFDAYKTARTTHFVCNHFPNTKLSELSKNHPRIKIKYVTVAWFVESIKAGKRLNEAIYAPPGLQTGQSFLNFKEKNVPNINSMDHNANSDFATSPVPATASHPSYMKKFFSSSRLHFIGTWRSRLPALVDELESERRHYDGGECHYMIDRFLLSQSKIETHSHVVHVDMDCFFVSVLLRSRPDLVEKPVAVAHSSSAGASEVSSCNYPARKKGVKAGMFMKNARDLCPDIVVMKYDFFQYEEVSKQLYKICLSFCPVVQPVSVDELYLEISSRHDAVAAAKYLRQEILDRTGCSASAGVGRNMLLARLATSVAKPDGLYVVPETHVDSYRKEDPSLSPTMRFMASIPIRSLPGVGRKVLKKIQEHGVPISSGASAVMSDEEEEDMEEKDVIETISCGSSSSSSLSGSIESCKDLWRFPLSTLSSWLGAAHAKSLYDACRGIDDRTLKTADAIRNDRKSIGAEVNYGHRYESDKNGTAMEKAERFLENLSSEVSRRLLEAQMVGYCITVKLMKRRIGAPHQTRKYLGHGECDTISKSRTLNKAVGRPSSREATGVTATRKESASASDAIFEIAVSLFRSMVVPSESRASNMFPPEDIRGMGIQVTRLEAIGGGTVANQGHTGSSNTEHGIAHMFHRYSNDCKENSSVANASLNHSPSRNSKVLGRHWNDDIIMPSASQIDYKVLSELDESFRQSLKKNELDSEESIKAAVYSHSDCGSDNALDTQQLSSSQKDFISSIPPELRDEALRQMGTRLEEAERAENLNEVEQPISKHSTDMPKVFDSNLEFPPAPSIIIPHVHTPLQDIYDTLSEWVESSGPGGLKQLSSLRKQAVTSFVIWLVNSKQLDKAMRVVKYVIRLDECCENSFWRKTRTDLEIAITLACREFYGCPVLL